jgi:lipid II:glycine glycyltransferase (peptidoglycan interpeptide bridge formation enzyme)
LVGAERKNLRVRLGHGGASLEWLLTRHEGHRRRKRLRAPASPFVLAIALAQRNKQATLAFTAFSGNEPIGAILVFRHGQSATYYVAWNGPKGRRLHANNLLLWHAVKELKSQGVKWLDLGGVDGLSMPGVSRFKIGMGGTLYTLAGTYL